MIPRCKNIVQNVQYFAIFIDNILVKRKIMKKIIYQFSRLLICVSLLSLGEISIADALTFPLPPPGSNVVGHVQWVQAMPGDTFSVIGRRYDVGYFQLVEANPGVDPKSVPAGSIIVIPSQFILPDAPRTGIVISLAELRLYYYPPGGKTVITYPVGVGRENWSTPLGVTHIVQKNANPVWTVPQSIKDDRAKQGINLPDSVQPGPENPLGGYAMRLGIQQQTYLIHGTNDYTGVGRRSSSGCIRMLPEDVEALFQKVPVGTPVNIIDTAYKAGWRNGKLYLESHVPLQEQSPDGAPNLTAMKQTVQAALNGHSGTIYWDKAAKIADAQNGVPQVIGYSGQS
jgi:L,D-transpeptidase ErfK/SrfK